MVIYHSTLAHMPENGSHIRRYFTQQHKDVRLLVGLKSTQGVTVSAQLIVIECLTVCFTFAD